MSFPGFPGPPGTGSPPPPLDHDLLSSTHADTTAAAPLLGDIITSPAGAIWERLAVGIELDHLVIVGGIPTWTAQAGSGLGDVTGPGSADDSYIAIYDGTSGKLIRQGLVTIDADGNLTSEGSIVASGGITSLGDLFVNNNLNVGNNAVISGDLTVLGNIVGFDLAASGFVVGPASAIDRSVAIYDGITGKLITDTLMTIDAGGNVNIGGDLLVSGDFSVLGDSTLENLTVNNTLNVGGNTTISGDLTILGNVSSTGLLVSTVASGTGPTFIVTNQFFNAVTNSVTNVILPSGAVLGQRHVVKDISGTAGSANITVTPSGGFTIDGLVTTDLVNNYEAIEFIFGPTEWNII